MDRVSGSMVSFPFTEGFSRRLWWPMPLRPDGQLSASRPVVRLFLPFSFSPKLRWWTLTTRGCRSLVGRAITRVSSHGPSAPASPFPPLPCYLLPPPLHFRLLQFFALPRSAACYSSLVVRSAACCSSLVVRLAGCCVCLRTALTMEFVVACPCG